MNKVSFNSVVIGGSGFIGSHFADALTNIDHNVTIYDRKVSKYKKNNQKFIKGKIDDKQKLSKLLKNADYVFHFAGVADIAKANKNPLKAINDNIIGTANILESCVMNNIKRIIFASSIYVYSNQGGIYRSTKQACELLIKNYSDLYGLKFTNLRLGSLYGSRANNFNPINKAILQAMNENVIDRQGDGKEIRNYINVKDAANNVKEIIKKKYENTNVDMMGSQSIRVSEMFDKISKYLNKKITINYSGISDEAHYKKNPFNYKPAKSFKLNKFKQINLDDGIKSLLKDIKN